MSEYLSARQAAKRYGLSEKTVRRWILSGRLDADKVGRDYRVFPEAIEAVLSRQREQDAPATVPHADVSAALSDLVRLVETQQQTIMELSGRVGYYQAQNEQLREQLALEAPKVEASTLGNAFPKVSAEPERRPWWRFW